MRPTLLDANAVLRYVLGDVPEQADETAEAVKHGAEVTAEVVAECVYVLAGYYEVPRVEISGVLLDVLDEAKCTRKEAVAEALRAFGSCNLDFVDCILLAEATVNRRDVLTFDKKLRERIADAATEQGAAR